MELEVQIDDVSACPGRCPGCILSASERKAAQPDMSDPVRGVVMARLEDYLKELIPEKVIVLWSIADHMMIGANYVKTLYRDTASMAARAGYVGKNASVCFTTSLIANERVAKQQIDDLSSMSKIEGIDLIPLVVLDPQLLRHKTFGPQWHAYAKMANSAFNRFDLIMNLSNVACAMMPPDELVFYAKKYDFKEVTVNWVPTPGNLIHTAMNMEEIIKWLIDFAKLAEANGVNYSYGPNLEQAARAFLNGKKDCSMIEGVKSGVTQAARHSFLVQADGSVCPLFEAVGEVSHSSRFGYERLGSLLDEPISAILDRSIDLMTRRIVSETMRDARCSGCEYLSACNSMGFHVYTHVLATKDREERLKNVGAKPQGNAECPHIAKALWEYTFSKIRTD